VSGFFQSAKNVWAEMKKILRLYWVTKIIRQQKRSQNVQSFTIRVFPNIFGQK
jgi:hypothetical protein